MSLGGVEALQVLEYLKSVQLILPPGAQPSYSNLGFGLIGHLVAERILGG